MAAFSAAARSWASSALREPPELVPAVVVGEFAGVALFVGADVVEARVGRPRRLPREVVGGGGEACGPSDDAARCERISTGDEAQEREFELHGGVPWVRGTAYATAFVSLATVSQRLQLCNGKATLHESALYKLRFCAPVARARYKSNLHCCAQQIPAFRTVALCSQRTDQNVSGDASRVPSKDRRFGFHPHSAHKGQVNDGPQARMRSNGAPHDSPADSAGAASAPHAALRAGGSPNNA